MDLLVLSEVRWGYFRTRKQFLLSRFPAPWRVFFAQPPAFGADDPWESRQEGRVTVFTVPFLKPGTTVLTGRVPGTPFEPKATVTVREAPKSGPVPARQVESFPLGQVVLDRDTRGRDTPFIRNRDKFIRGLAASDPDSFLYNFRDAFGEKQPTLFR